MVWISWLNFFNVFQVMSTYYWKLPRLEIRIFDKIKWLFSFRCVVFSPLLLFHWHRSVNCNCGNGGATLDANATGSSVHSHCVLLLTHCFKSWFQCLNSRLMIMTNVYSYVGSCVKYMRPTC